MSALTLVLRERHNRIPSAAHLGVDLVGIHEYLVLKYDGTTAHFPVVDGDREQAETRASLCRLPGDCIVAVTEHSYVCVCPEAERESRALPPLESPAS